MKHNHLIILAAIGIIFTGCKEPNTYTTKAQCEQSMCTKEHCYVWSAELNRCGTAEALKKEEARVKKMAKQAEQKDSAKAVLPKAIRDSIAKIDKKEKSIKAEIKNLKTIADSLRIADSVSGTQVSATAYLKSKLEAEKENLNRKYKALMDSVEVLNLVNHKQITAVQWIEYNKRKKKSSLDHLEKKKEKIKQPETKATKK